MTRQMTQFELEDQLARCDLRGDGGPFDIIGDVHGCAGELEALLGRLGYDVRWAGAPGAVRVSASHSFAVTWLMPRLGALRARGLEIELIIRQGLDGLRDGQADLAICGGDAAPADFASEVLVELDAFVVSAPTPAGGAPVEQIDDLSDHALLTTAGGANLWSRWFEQVGRPAAPPRASQTFPTLQAMYEAAASGMGLALAVPLASERLLAEGRLVRRLNAGAPIGQQYRVVHAERPRRACTAHEAFVDWLKTETAASRDRFHSTPVAHEHYA